MSPSATQPSTYWPGRQQLLMLAQAGFVITTLICMLLAAIGIPFEFAGLAQPCVNCDGPQLSAIGAARLAGMGLSPQFYATFLLSFELLFVVVWMLVGILIFWRRREDPVALLVALMLVTFGAAYPNLLVTAGQAIPALQPLILFVTYAAVVAFVAFFYVFPDGRFVPAWTAALVLGWALLSLVAMWVLSRELFVTAGAETADRASYFSAYFVILAGGVVAQIWRFSREHDPERRQQTKWVVSAICVAIVGFFALSAVSDIVPQTFQLNHNPLVALIVGPLFYLFMTLIPLAIGVSVLRYRLWDIDPLLSRALVYGLLTASVLAVYVLVVAGLGALFQARSNPLIALTATGVVAVLFQPLRERLQSAVNRVVYGERKDPYLALSALSRRLESTITPDMVWPALVETVALALRVPYVALLIQQNETLVVAAEYPEPGPTPLTGFKPVESLRAGLDVMPLSYQGEQTGELRLARRAPAEQSSAADRRLLGDLARQAGAVLHAVRLTADLRASRENIVMMREDERRRLRRDLHDGLGPTLASHTMQLEAARDLLDVRPAMSTELLTKILGQARRLRGDIQRLIDELRPPTLDELGLCDAIRHMAAQYAHGGLLIDVDVPSRMHELPAAVEVACYRIAQEALTNVVRHARARHCRVRLTVGDILVCLEIGDDGIGIAPEQRRGVGLNSIRERAEALGGFCSIQGGEQAGLSVMVFLPIPPSDEQEAGDA